ncbi:hypothetical protein Rctr85_074 [Virus Rctr85]|nr:hypothetical protein Rctr85_074 [Virus Rctr85]
MPQFAMHLAQSGEAHCNQKTKAGVARMLITQNDDHLCGRCAEQLGSDFVIVAVVLLSKQRSTAGYCNQCQTSRLKIPTHSATL